MGTRWSRTLVDILLCSMGRWVIALFHENLQKLNNLLVETVGIRIFTTDFFFSFWFIVPGSHGNVKLVSLCGTMCAHYYVSLKW